MFEEVLKRDEAVTLKLRDLYERHGYQKYKMSRFEAYDLYLDHRSFLNTQHIITFSDMDGRVLALKPDVTLSIAKNTRATRNSSEKLYYLENVYRFDAASRIYREIPQLGLECFGALDGFALGEVVCLAAQTLGEISSRNILTLSHTGFVLKLMEGLSIDQDVRTELIRSIHLKRSHEILSFASRYGITDAVAQMLSGISELDGMFPDTIRKARNMAILPSMSEALDQLECVYTMLCEAGLQENVRLDFSLIVDTDYYSGLMFEGFVEGLPRPVLSGGYYGGLMQKFNRNLDAIGFAVYLNELGFLYSADGQAGGGTVVLYDEDADPVLLYRSVQELIRQGKRVRTERAVPADLKPETVYRFREGILEEVRQC